MRTGALFSTIIIFFVVYVPLPNSPYLWYCIMFAMGACCSVYQLAFSYVNSFADRNNQGLVDGITNMLCMSGAPILQPAIGFILTSKQGGVLDGLKYIHQISIGEYVLPLAILINILFRNT